MADIYESSLLWLEKQFDSFTDHIEHIRPRDFIEQNRYLPKGQTIFPGPMRLSLTPYWIEPLNKIDPRDPTREIWIKKGVKTSLTTTLLENAALYYAAHVKSLPMAYFSADQELANARLNTRFLSMFQKSGFKNIFKSSDEDSGSKRGKTKNYLEFIGGASLRSIGAKNADKLRDFQFFVELLDEMDSFALDLLGEGDIIRLIMSRCDANWGYRKILGGSTPLLKGYSHIDRMYKRGTQKQYECRCLKCGYPMPLRWFKDDLSNPGVRRGMRWDYPEGSNVFDPNSVRYECHNCGHAHVESDKPRFISEENSEWKATAEPVAPGIESYHIPAALSRFKAWSDLVIMHEEAFYPNGKMRSEESMKTFYNLCLGDVFEVQGKKLPEKAAYSHRREFYHSGQILNDQIEKYNESGILFLVMTVDVQKHFLAVAVWGVTASHAVWLIEYKKLKDQSEEGCLEIDSPAWCELRRMIDDQEWISEETEDSKVYRPNITLIDCGWGESEAVVTDFCADWNYGVYPIKGDSQSKKRISSYYEYQTSSKMNAYMIAVDHYKDRMAPVMRRRWFPEDGDQPKFHINFPVDITNAAMKELVAEFKRPEKNSKGEIQVVWHRPPGVNNELWDLLIYCMAGIDIFARLTCLGNLELRDTDWKAFWEYALTPEDGEFPFFNIAG